MLSLSDAFQEAESQHHLIQLTFLQNMLRLRRDVKHEEFIERFPSEEAAERALKLCLVQGLSVSSKISANYNWHYFEDSWLDAPLPGFNSAWDFFDRFDSGLREPAGFFLIPPADRYDLEPSWVPLEVYNFPSPF